MAVPRSSIVRDWELTSMRIWFCDIVSRSRHSRNAICNTDVPTYHFSASVTPRYRRGDVPTNKSSKQLTEPDNFATLCPYRFTIGETFPGLRSNKLRMLDWCRGRDSQQSMPHDGEGAMITRRSLLEAAGIGTILAGSGATVPR